MLTESLNGRGFGSFLLGNRVAISIKLESKASTIF